MMLSRPPRVQDILEKAFSYSSCKAELNIFHSLCCLPLSIFHVSVFTSCHPRVIETELSFKLHALETQYLT